jgi:hypothetical protein
MKVHAIQTGEVQIKSRHQRARFEDRLARFLDVLTDPDWSPRLPIGAWLIEHPEGLILVDTGESSHANDPGYQPGGIRLRDTASADGSAPRKRSAQESAHSILTRATFAG